MLILHYSNSGSTVAFFRSPDEILILQCAPKGLEIGRGAGLR